MATQHEHHDDRPDPAWSHRVSKWTFLLTVALAALYVGAVALYVR